MSLIPPLYRDGQQVMETAQYVQMEDKLGGHAILCSVSAVGPTLRHCHQRQRQLHSRSPHRLCHQIAGAAQVMEIAFSVMESATPYRMKTVANSGRLTCGVVSPNLFQHLRRLPLRRHQLPLNHRRRHQCQHRCQRLDQPLRPPHRHLRRLRSLRGPRR